MPGLFRSLRRLSSYLGVLLFAVALCAALLQIPASAAAGDEGTPAGLSSGGWGGEARKAAPATKGQDAAPGQVVVVLSRDAQPTALSKTADKAKATLQSIHSARSDEALAFAIYSSTESSTEELIEQFQGQPGVAAVSANYTRVLCGVPDDPFFAELWGLENTGQTGGTADADIDASTAWDITTGSGAVVAVIDTGVDYTHEDLAGNMWVNPGETPGNGLDDDANGYIDDIYGIDPYEGDTDPLDDYGHGTHIAGTVAAVGDNSLGVAGVAYGARIMALRAGGSGGLTDADAIECINYAIDMKTNHGVNVVAINASWGSYSYGSALDAAVEAAGEAGIVFVAAAGNDTTDIDSSPFYPAASDSPYVISVGASDDNDAPAEFSNYGATSVDLFAPGVDILSTYFVTGSYASVSGTSMAAPHVAGAVALVAATAPAESVTARVARILASVDTPGDLAGLCATDGRLNVATAVVTTVAKPTIASVSPSSGPVTGGATVTITGSDFTGASGAGGVTFGGKYALDYTVDSDTQITATTPFHMPGTVQVQVKALDFSDDTAADDFTYVSQSSWFIQRVTVSSEGVEANGDTWGYSVSDDGRYVAFSSIADNLVPGDTNHVFEIFVYDRQTETIKRVSDADGIYPAISGNGRYVGYISGGEVYVYDLVTGETNWASEGAPRDHYEHSPFSLSTDGRYVCFGWTYGATYRGDIFVYDRTLGTTRNVTQSANSTCGNPKISGNGRYVAFRTRATNLGSTDTNFWTDIYVCDLQTGGFSRASYTSSGGQPDQDVESHSISADGRYVAFDTYASNMVPGDTNGGYDVFLRDRWAGTTTRVSLSSTGSQISGSAVGGSLSSDGRKVVFIAMVNDIVPGDTNDQVDVFVRDLSTGLVQRMSVAADGAQGNGESSGGLISGDGRWVAFYSEASNLVVGDSGPRGDVFVASVLNPPVEQTDPHITYVGDWYPGWNSLASGGNFAYTSTKDAGAIISFQGTSVAWIGKNSPAYGKAWVKLDDQEPVIIDLYSASEVYQQTLWAQYGLGDGAHTLVIKCLHEKNEFSTGYYINVDALRVGGSLVAVSRSEQNAPEINQSGDFVGGWSALYSGGSFRYFDSPGCAVSVKFEGQYLAWIAKKSPVYGQAKVKLDDGPLIPVDLYNATTLYQQKVYDTGLLDPGVHTLTIYWTGEKNPAAGGTYVNTDAFEVLGTLLAAPAAEPIAYTFQQTDARITYLGGPWYTGWSASASGSNFTYTETEGAGALIKFQGTSLALVGKTSPVYGQVEVTLDGGAPVLIDLYSETTLYQQTLWSAEGLDNTTHSLVVRCLHEKNLASGGYYVNLDALEIKGFPTATTGMITRSEQNAPEINQSGDFVGGWSALYSGGSFRYFDSPGCAVSVKFEGQYLAWIAKKSPVYGQAKVSLDDGPLVPVDLYSASTLYQQKVYDTGLLDPGVHTLTIYWTGEKNPASSGTYVNTDAFEVLGTLLAAPVAEPIAYTYQQTDARITYLGGPWYTGWSTSASGGNFTYTDTEGAMALIKFQGTSIALVGKTSPVYGQAEVSLDGGAPVIIDLYSETTLYQQKFVMGGLDDTTHTLVVRCLHEKNPASGGHYVNLDALEIMGAPVASTGMMTRYQQNDPLIDHLGIFYGGWSALYSGGSFRYFDSSTTVTVTFQGQQAAWIAKMSPVYGLAEVRLDGGDPIPVDLYNTTTLYQQKVYETGLLPEGEHTLTITWKNDKNPSSSGTYVNTDAFDVLGYLMVPTS